MIIRRILNLYRKIFWPLAKQAKKAGVKMGENNFISSHFWSTEPYLIEIGSNCQITAGVKIFTHGGGNAVRKFNPNFDCFGKVVIGNYVYLGDGAKVMPGVTIGDNVIVAAGSVVTKSIPSNVVVGGNPAVYICSIQEYIERNKSYNLSTKGLNYAQKREVLLSTPEDKFIKKQIIQANR